MQRGLARARTHNLLEYTRKGLKIVQSIMYENVIYLARFKYGKTCHPDRETYYIFRAILAY